MASFSTSSSSCRHDVFISFRGEDTRQGFNSHLIDALRGKQINTFIDEELERGDEISPALLNAIEVSKISIIVFSKDYANSKWCLDELVKILECHELSGQIVVPIFYHVDPSDVRKQTGSYRDAFVKYEDEFKEMPEKVQSWKHALTKTSHLSGWPTNKVWSEAEFVDKIVDDIQKKLEQISSINKTKSLLWMIFSVFRGFILIIIFGFLFYIFGGVFLYFCLNVVIKIFQFLENFWQPKSNWPFQ